MNSDTHATVDVRRLAPRERHPIVFSTFDGLKVGGVMELVNDHDPQPLFFQFQSRLPGGFTWTYQEAGPTTWRVKIRRLTGAAASEDGCRGGCACG